MDHLKTTIDSIRNLKREHFNEQFLPGVIEHKRRNDSQFSNLLQQLWGTERVLCHLSSSNSEAHWPLLQELDSVVGRAMTLVKEVCFKSKDSTSSLEHDTGEHYLEVFLDLRWWTWVLICNAPFRDPCRRKSFFVTPKGVLDLSSSRLPSFLQRLYLWWSSSDGYARRLPSYGIEVFVQKTQGLSSLVEWLKPESGKPLDKFVLQSAEIFIIEGKVLVPVLYAQKPSWVGNELKVDLTQVFLGMSSSGLVIKCKDSGTEYALKRVQNLDQRQPVIARLCHPHIVQLMSYWRENGFLFLMMELMEGDFKDLIKRRLRVKKSPFIMNVVLDILLQIAKAMLYLHDMGLTHPHLKSSDVLFKEATDRSKLDKNDTKYLVKLGDFQFYSHNDFESMAQQNVYQFGLICLEVLSTEPLHWELEERVMGVSKEPGLQFDEIQKSHGDAIPGSLTQCITRCLYGSIKFSEVVVRLLLAQLQVLLRATKETSPRSLDSEHQGILSSPGSSSRFTMITEEVGEEVAEVGKGTSVQDEIEQQTVNSEADPFHPILNDGVDEFVNALPKALSSQAAVTEGKVPALTSSRVTMPLRYKDEDVETRTLSLCLFDVAGITVLNRCAACPGAARAALQHRRRPRESFQPNIFRPEDPDSKISAALKSLASSSKQHESGHHEADTVLPNMFARLSLEDSDGTAGTFGRSESDPDIPGGRAELSGTPPIPHGVKHKAKLEDCVDKYKKNEFDGLSVPDYLKLTRQCQTLESGLLAGHRTPMLLLLDWLLLLFGLNPESMGFRAWSQIENPGAGMTLTKPDSLTIAATEACSHYQ